MERLVHLAPEPDFLQMFGMAKMLWAFDINADPHSPPVVDERVLYSDTFIGAPHPFAARFSVRSEKHRDILEREYEQARDFLRRYEQ